jgi:hypothetical protein
MRGESSKAEGARYLREGEVGFGGAAEARVSGRDRKERQEQKYYTRN